MKAVLVEEETKLLYIGNYDEPILKDDELLVKVKATALNRSDLLQRKGLYSISKDVSPILGIEMSGDVIQVGKNVKNFKVGDRVYGLLSGGGYAEKVTIHSQLAMRIPDFFTYEEAAAIPEAFLTAYLNLIKIGGTKKGDHALIHAGASGVGTAAIQLANEIGATSIVTSSSKEKLDICSYLGATFPINYKKESFSKKVLEITKNKGVDIILDFIGSSFWQENMKSISVYGKWIVLGGLGGYEVNVNLRDILAKRIQIIGSTLRTRSVQEKIELTKDFEAFSYNLFKEGKLKPVIDSIYNWRDVMEAHQYMEDNNNIGKIILKVN